MHEWHLLVCVVGHLILDVDLWLLSVLGRREWRLLVRVSLLRRDGLVGIVLEIWMPRRQHGVVRDDVHTAFWPQFSLGRRHDVVIFRNASPRLEQPSVLWRRGLLLGRLLHLSKPGRYLLLFQHFI